MTTLPSHYGNYKVPPLIEELFRLEAELNQEESSLENAFSFMLLKEDMRYINTPLDVIPFANTGMDGIHYGFLTDFGRVSDLEQAWIVTVSPMDHDDPVWPIACNLQEFLRAVYTDPAALLNSFENGEGYREHAKTQEQRHFDTEEIEIRRRFAERFGIAEIDDIGEYLDQARLRRSREVTLPTDNGIGVVSSSHADPALEDATSSPVSVPEVDRNFDWNERREEIQTFWQKASQDQKYVFLRNAQSAYIFDDPDCLEWFFNRLEQENRKDYAAALAASFQHVLIPEPDYTQVSVAMWGSTDSGDPHQD